MIILLLPFRQNDHLPLASSPLLSLSPVRLQHIWSVREAVAVAFNEYRTFLLFDVTLDQNIFYAIVDACSEFCRQHSNLADVVISGFGHFGDGRCTASGSRGRHLRENRWFSG